MESVTHNSPNDELIDSDHTESRDGSESTTLTRTEAKLSRIAIQRHVLTDIQVSCPASTAREIYYFHFLANYLIYSVYIYKGIRF